MGERLTQATAHQASWFTTDEPSLLQTSLQLLIFRAAPTDSQIHTFSGTQVSKSHNTPIPTKSLDKKAGDNLCSRKQCF